MRTKRSLALLYQLLCMTRSAMHMEYIYNLAYKYGYYHLIWKLNATIIKCHVCAVSLHFTICIHTISIPFASICILIAPSWFLFDGRGTFRSCMVASERGTSRLGSMHFYAMFLRMPPFRNGRWHVFPTWPAKFHARSRLRRKRKSDRRSESLIVDSRQKVIMVC